MTNEKWWWHDKDFEMFWGGCFECCEYEKLLEKIERIATEAERRGYEKAMKKVREAVIPTAATLTLSSNGNEETIDVYYIPKFFDYIVYYF